ncbi:glycine--tRNA ligase [Candidatus Marinimicrobia bacterium MT.SAG.3]|nr:glycine--tRNA ligase [Candidatus Marinimicrobia bacterium MT.SAG.3]
MPDQSSLMDKIVSLAKRRGFIFQGSEIYGGVGSTYDYGPLGVELKMNIKNSWWTSMTHRRDVVGLDAAILMHPKVWEASGHVDGFTDPMIDCKQCKSRFREDDLSEKNIESGQCPKCGTKDSLTEARQFNLMFKTHIGPLEDSSSIAYLRPETAQGIYVNFKNVLDTSRQKIPFGIAQIGKAFRNEITPGNFIFRTREFEQMEMQYFVHPSDDEKYFEIWKDERLKWYDELGINKEKLRLHEHSEDELAHYAKKAFDIEYEFPFGWKELEGIHNRTDFDLQRHIEHSGKKLDYFDEKNNERFVPYVIETSAGVDRTTLTCLIDAYEEEEVKGEKRVVLKFSPKIAPIKVGIFPLVNKDGLPEIAEKIAEDISKNFAIFYDSKGAIGRRYRRMDEAGTPFGITVDHQTLEDGSVTLRDRDSMIQERIAAEQANSVLSEKFKS